MAVNTWDGAVNSDFGNPGNWNTTGLTDRNPTADDDVIIPNVSNDPVVDTDYTINSLEIQSGGNLDGDGNTLTIDGENAAGYAVDLDGIITGTDTDLTITTAALTLIDLTPSSGAIRNLTINHSSCVAEYTTTHTLSGDLTVTAGTYRFQAYGLTLTVTGDVSIANGATLGYVGGTAGASTTSFGSLTIASGGTYVNGFESTTTITGENGSGFALQNSGTFTHNSGTVQTDHADTAALFGSGGCYNWIVNSATTIHDGNLTVYNNLTINASKLLKPDNDSRVFTVHGLTTIAGTFGLAANTGTHKLNHVDVTGTLQIGTNQTIDLTGLRNISGTVT